MKVFITSTLLITFLLLGIRTQAQNLGYGQVVLLTFPTNASSGTTSPLYTVPAGKVWKIESAGSGTNYLYVSQLNGYTTSTILASNNNSYNNSGNLPLWLPAGTTIKFSVTNNGAGTGAYVSILEFTPGP